MNNEELKEKIVDTMHPILKGTRVSCNEEDACEHCLFPCEVDRIVDRLADALIEAGVVDKSDYASMKETAVKYKAEVSNAENREKAAEHRAEVAERALRIFAENCSCADCPFFGGCQIIPDVEDDFSCCFDMYLAIAEKDLMDERK